MPLPTIVCLALGSGTLAALAASVELKISPRSALLTRSFFAYLFFVAFVFVPASAYFYVFHGDWFLLYAFDVRRIPSAAALIGFIALGALAAASFAFGAHLLRAQKLAWVWFTTILAWALSLLIPALASSRLEAVGSYAQFEGSFGLVPFAQTALLPSAIVMGALMAAGFAFVVVRLYVSSRRGTS